MRTSLFLFLAAGLFPASTLAVGGMMGGFREADVTQDEVVAAGKVGMVEMANTDAVKYGGKYDLVSASKQVVAGINYKLTIKPHHAGECEMLTLMVWDHFGDVQLMSHESSPCPASD